jgi:hypothetical protein
MHAHAIVAAEGACRMSPIVGSAPQSLLAGWNPGGIAPAGVSSERFA